MSSSRLYLVRRDSREFIGPMPVDDFKRRLSRMEFGMQDEVSGHRGPWIVLDKKDDLSHHYPEIAGLLGDSLPLSWRETTGHARVISRQDSRKDRKRKSSERSGSSDSLARYVEKQKTRSRTMKISASIVVGIAVLAGLVIIGKKDDIPPVADMSVLAQKADPSEFLNMMGIKVVPAAARMTRSQKLQGQWLPLLRMYAFYTTGAIEGVPAKLLKGDLPSFAPQECSVESWKRKWRENAAQTVQFVQGKALQKNPWTKLLAQDPNWIKRRPSKGWVKPRNFYEGCVMTASLAIRSISSDTTLGAEPHDGVTPDIVAAVSRRLQNQLDILSGNKISGGVDATSFLRTLTCFESQPSISDLGTCRVNYDPAVKPLLDEHEALGLVRLASIGQGAVDPRWTATMLPLQQKLGPDDIMSRSDQSGEVKLVGYVMGGMPVEQAVAKVEQEYVDLRFR